MRPKHQLQAEANAETTSGPHDLGGPSAAPNHVVAAASGGRHHVVVHHIARFYFQHWPPLAFSALAPYNIIRFGPRLDSRPLV